MRVVPAGDFLMGSTDAEIKAVISGDRDGPQFSLRNETPQFRAHLPAFSIGVHAVTNEQFARFLTESQPKPEQLSEWVSSLDRIYGPAISFIQRRRGNPATFTNILHTGIRCATSHGPNEEEP